MIPRITQIGRDPWSSPGNITPARSEITYRFERTTDARMREMHGTRGEPLWKSVAAVLLIAVAVVAMMVL